MNEEILTAKDLAGENLDSEDIKMINEEIEKNVSEAIKELNAMEITEEERKELDELFSEEDVAKRHEIFLKYHPELK